MNRSRTKCLQIIDNGLKSKVGHHFNYDRAIVNAAAQKGIPAVLWGHADISDEEIAAIAVPHFSHYLYSSYPDQDLDRAIEVQMHNLRQVLERSGDDGLLFVPNSLVPELAAFRLLLNSCRFTNPLAILVRYKENVIDGPQSAEYLSLLRDICRLHTLTKVYADTRALVDILARNGIQAQLINFPIEIPYAGLTFDQRFDFAYVGQVGPHKGFYHFINALFLGAQIGFLPRVAIQATLLDPETIDDLKAKLPHVVWIAGPLDTLAYYQLLASSDTVLTFYDAEFYPVTSSNILVEALALNRRVLTSNFAFAAELLGDDLDSYASPSYDHNALLQKMIQMKDDHFLPRSFLKRTDHARNLANPGLLVDLLFA